MSFNFDPDWDEPCNRYNRERAADDRAEALIDYYDDLRKERIMARDAGIEEENLLQLQLNLKTRK